MKIESKQPHTSSLRGRQILEWRKEIEQELVYMLKETDPPSPQLRQGYDGHSKATERAGSDFTLAHVRDAIYNEEDNDDMIHPIGYKKLSNGVKVVAIFDRGRDSATQTLN